MSTLTPKLGLLKPAGTEFILRLPQFNDNWDLLDGAAGSSICTSGTRPSTGNFLGRVIFETDTKAFVECTNPVGPVWQYVTTAFVTSIATRNALTPKHDGLQVYRSERNWYEIYDGTAFRVIGKAQCTTTADRDTNVTNPERGSEAFCASVLTSYTHDGNVWVPEGTGVGKIAATAGQINSGIGSTEVNIAKLQVIDFRVLTDVIYIFNMHLWFNLTSQSTDASYSIRVRYFTALTGSIIVEDIFRPVSVDNFDDTKNVAIPWKSTTTDTGADFFVSIQRIAGTGTLSVAGSNKSAFWIDTAGGDSNVWTAVP